MGIVFRINLRFVFQVYHWKRLLVQIFPIAVINDTLALIIGEITMLAMKSSETRTNNNY